ncbi:LodA/GoxA family CTQ-dependent oxidase [Brevibacillus dissolubilis]|uniref:LodA/GoxA family CTQ-dependent oxidase n=1 Tax=Brevibacillus dissolubilis TaxID=1844116 RepID=UPI001115CAA3|nr:LodA/GoxA family CTQ-dependent oxidase [Brevibacillus dissolubilis]
MSDQNPTKAGQSGTEDPIAGLKKMFVDGPMGRAIAQGQCPVQRPVFRKTHGCAAGTFKICPDLPQELRVGVFGYEEFPAWVRFSSDEVAPTGADIRKPLGMAIKLFGVLGRKILEGDENATTHDFLLQNNNVFFVDTVKDMYEFTYAGQNGELDSYYAAHPRTEQIVNEMNKLEKSVLNASYWSILPFAFGPNQYVKYKITPAVPTEVTVDTTNPNYLHDELKKRLLTEEVALHFHIQLRTNDGTMPLDQATVAWDESESEPIHVATLVLHKQDIDAQGQQEYGENLSFNTWRVLPEHTPIGSISEARKVVYKASAEVRRYENGVPIVEPNQPRSLKQPIQVQDNQIVDVVIHPAIGIARVGNSESEYFLGPEIPGVHQIDPQDYRDSTGCIKRQGARFRLFGRNRKGEIVQEITADQAEITWSVHVSNVKAAWYDFDLALDIPAAMGQLPGVPATASTLRNANQARTPLIIDPGKITISGKNTNTDGSQSRYAFDKGQFFDQQVYLGELRTDENGHLIFLGGYGKSATVGGDPTTFANNDGWHDDVSDGPVDATVVLNGQVFEAKGAWVLVGPPDYTPGVQAIITGYDLMQEAGFELDPNTKPKRPTFSQHIYPILKRFSDYQWVNAGFAEEFGWGSPLDFTNSDFVAQLNDPSDDKLALRQSIFTRFRNPHASYQQADAWPGIYGDGATLVPTSTDPREWMSILPSQYQWLKQWAMGDFISDGLPKVKTWDEMTPAERAHGLDRAALDETMGGPFHPGCEFTWPMRHSMMFSEPFRIKRRNARQLDFGSTLTSPIALGEGGPLDGSYAGDITRWMAVPWQTDTSSCLSAYRAFSGEYLPTFWPARVPNDVLTEANYQIIMDGTNTKADKIQAFSPATRQKWLRGIQYTTGNPAKSLNYVTGIKKFISQWNQVGIITSRPGPEHTSMFPQKIWVETGRQISPTEESE